MYNSQNNESEVVINYFQGCIGNLLSLGENDGKYLSNSYDLIQLGWGADLFEPIPGNAQKIVDRHSDKPNVYTHFAGIANSTGTHKLYVTGGSVIAVLDEQLLKDWNYEKQYEIDCQFYTWADAIKSVCYYKQYNYITIDCEGLDWQILQQMDLGKLGCECICVEQGNDPINYERIKEYCSRFGLTNELLYNFENVILAK